MLELGPKGFTDSRDQDEDVLVRAFLDISTAHVSQNDLDLLKECAEHEYKTVTGKHTDPRAPCSGWPILTSHFDCGFVVRPLAVDVYAQRAKLLGAGFSLALVELCFFATRRGYNGLWLDADAPKYDRFHNFVP